MDLMEHRVLDQMQSITLGVQIAYLLHYLQLSCSILVDPHTGHQDITLPSFCCKVCDSNREKMIKDVIAEVVTEHFAQQTFRTSLLAQILDRSHNS